MAMVGAKYAFFESLDPLGLQLNGVYGPQTLLKVI